MKTLQKTTYVVLFAFLAIVAGCSKSDDSNLLDPDGNGNGNGQAGAPHTYDITMDGQRYTGEISNTEDEQGGAAVLIVEDGITKISSTLINNEINVVGVFQYTGNGNNISIDDEADSAIAFLPGSFGNNTVSYYSKSGTAKVTVGERIGSPGIPSYVIAVEVEFQGTFSYTDIDGNEQTVAGSGSYKVNLPR